MNFLEIEDRRARMWSLRSNADNDKIIYNKYHQNAVSFEYGDIFPICRLFQPMHDSSLHDMTALLF